MTELEHTLSISIRWTKRRIKQIERTIKFLQERAVKVSDLAAIEIQRDEIKHYENQLSIYQKRLGRIQNGSTDNN